MHYLSQSVAILLTIFILILWRSHKKTGSSTERIFIALITIAFISEVLDLVIQFTIAPYPLYSPGATSTIVIKLYLISLIAYLVVMGFYVERNINNINESKRNKTKVILLGLVLVAVACVLDVDYVYHPSCSIFFGPAVVYVMCLAVAMCLLYSLILFKNKKRISNWIRIITTIWIIDFAIGIVFQYFTISDLYLPTISINTVVGIMFLYLCNENPGSRYDYHSECFYYETFAKYLQDVISNKISQACLMINIRVKNQNNLVYCKEIFDDLINNKENEDAKFFKGIGSELYITVDNVEKLKEIEKTVINDAASIERTNNQVKFYITMVMVPEVKIADSFQIIKAIFDSNRSKGINDSESVVEKLVDNELIEEYRSRFAIVREIESAVRNDRVEVDYQIIHDLNSNDVYAQANSNILLENNSILTTSSYYEVAVEYDLLKDIRDIKLKVINETIKNIIKEENNKLSIIFLHTSVQELEEEFYYEEYISAFNGDASVMSKTCLEITNIETIVHKDILINNIEKLQKYGVKFAVAGFGTGESNLNYFVDLPIQFVRFDKTIIDNAIKDQHALMIMKDINVLAQSLNFGVIATGRLNDNFNSVINECGINMYFDDAETMVSENNLVSLCKGGDK